VTTALGKCGLSLISLQTYFRTKSTQKYFKSFGIVFFKKASKKKKMLSNGGNEEVAGRGPKKIDKKKLITGDQLDARMTYEIRQRRLLERQNLLQDMINKNIACKGVLTTNIEYWTNYYYDVLNPEIERLELQREKYARYLVTVIYSYILIFIYSYIHIFIYSYSFKY
jgi:hypothetical protein